MTYDEWKAEQEAQIQAQIDGEEYEPVTHMGMVNQDIRDTNELRGILNEQIVDLEEYKETLEQEIEEQYIPHVRNNFPLSNEQSDSLQFVAKRVHGYVTFESAKSNLEQVENWGKSLDFKIRKVVAESNMIDNAEKDYNKDSTRAIRYGLSPQNFTNEKADKIAQINKQAPKLESSYASYQSALKHSQIAYEVQKEIVHKEFGSIYPEYSHITEDRNDLITELKHKYVQDYLKSGVKLESIQEFEDPKQLANYSAERSSDLSLINDWKDNQHSLLIANRTVSKASREYKEIYQGGSTKDTIYSSRLKLETVKEQVAERESDKAQLDGRLNQSLEMKYSNQPYELIERIPTKLKAKLVELQLEGRSTGKLSKDLKQVEKDLAKEGKDISRLYDKEFTPTGAMGIAKLFSNLSNLASGNDKQHDTDEMRRKRKSKMREKSLQKDIELEL